MRETWDKNKVRRYSDGQPVAKKWNITDPLHKPKGLTHSPSLRAMRNYNDLPIDKTSDGVDNPGFETSYKYEYYIEPDYTTRFSNQSETKTNEYDYPTISTRSIRTTHSGSENQSNHEYNEMGSSVKLVTAKVEMSCKSWCTHISTVICTISMAANLGNLYRLPQTTIIRGGLPFLVIYAILTVIIGLPLLFLELGIGQMAGEGFIKCWRAVPFFKGIGYVKLLAGCLLSIYYPLYIGLALLYLIWILRGSTPFSECYSGVIITDTGYVAASDTGQECIRNTFIKRPFDDPFYFGIYAALLLFIWIIITILSIRRTKTYIKSLMVLFFPTIICYIALTTKSILLEAETKVLYKFFENADWTVLESAEVWYYATIQVFFSTSIGFGSFITNAGIMYNKISPFWTALGYIATNLIFGAGTVIMTSIITAASNSSNSSSPSTGDIAEVQLFTAIYDAMIHQNNQSFQDWMIATYLFFVFSGLVSMATLSYTLLKAIYSHDGVRLKWWQTSVVFSSAGFVVSCLALLREDFDLVHLLDHYVVGNLIVICVVVEVLAIITFYGTTRIQSDFEFMLGHILSKVWLFLWWLAPLMVAGILIWGLVTLSLQGIFRDDPVWMYALGWAVVLTAFIFIFAMGFFVMIREDGYTIYDKLKTSLEPSHNWGPKDPMLRYNWVQWNSKSQSGERDFTLKRRGTKEYTRTIRKKAKKEANELNAISSVQGAYIKSENNNHITNGHARWTNGIDPNRISNGSSNYNSLYYPSSVPPRIEQNGTRLAEQESTYIDSLEPEIAPKTHYRPRRPRSKTINSSIEYVNDENSEGYGTFRNKGPYVIGSEVGHVCDRGLSEHEAITEL